MKKGFLWICMFSLLFVFFEATSLLALFALKEIRELEYKPLSAKEIEPRHKDILSDMIQNKNNYTKFSPTLGWKIKANGRSPLYRSNADGIRADREYERIIPSNIVRIASFGDSFTHGDEVENKYTWQSQMSATEENLEVINFGVGGYGLDQAFLRYKEDGLSYNPNIVFIGYMTENIARSVSVYRPFYVPETNGPLAKPRFIINENALELIDNPIQKKEEYFDLLRNPEKVLPRLGEKDFFYQTKYHKSMIDVLPSVRLFKILHHEFFQEKFLKDEVYNENSEAFKVTIKIFDKFVKSTLQNNSLPVILVFPYDHDLYTYGTEGTKGYQPLLNYFEDKEYIYVDLLDAFNKLGYGLSMNDFFPNKAHYSPLGNKLVASYIMSYLKGNNLLDQKSIKRKMQEYKFKLE